MQILLETARTSVHRDLSPQSTNCLGSLQEFLLCSLYPHTSCQLWSRYPALPWTSGTEAIHCSLQRSPIDFQSGHRPPEPGNSCLTQSESGRDVESRQAADSEEQLAWNSPVGPTWWSVGLSKSSPFRWVRKASKHEASSPIISLGQETFLQGLSKSHQECRGDSWLRTSSSHIMLCHCSWHLTQGLKYFYHITYYLKCIYYIIYSVFIYYGTTCAMVYMWTSKGNLWESVVSFQHVGTEVQTVWQAWRQIPWPAGPSH